MKFLQTKVQSPEAAKQSSVIECSQQVTKEDTQINNVEEKEWKKSCLCVHVQRHLLLYSILIAAAVGICIGWVIKISTTPTPVILMWTAMLGTIYLRLLKLMVVPFMVCNMIVGIAKLDKKARGKVGLRGLGYFFLTNIFCVLLAVVVGSLINSAPMEKLDEVHSTTYNSDQSFLEPSDIFADLLRNVFPENIFQAAVKQEVTVYKKISLPGSNINSSATNDSVVQTERSTGFIEGSNVLGLVFFSVIIGTATHNAGEQGKPFLFFMTSVADVFYIVLRWFIWLTPPGVASLVAAAVAQISDIRIQMAYMGSLVLVIVTITLFLHFVFYPLVFFIFTRKNYFRLWKMTFRGWLVGTITTSAPVAIPDILTGLDKFGCDGGVSRVLLPLGSAINVDGSIFFVTYCTMFLARMEGIEFSSAQLVTLVSLNIMMSLGLPPIPGSSIVTLIVVLSTMSVPMQNIGLLFTVEWLIDRVRTTNNIMGLITGTAMTALVCRSSSEYPELDVVVVDKV